MKRRFFSLTCCLMLLTSAGSVIFGTTASQDADKPRQLNVADGAVTIVLDPVVTTGLSSPIYVTNAHDGTNRLFIVEQGGIIKVLQPGSSTPTVFLDITTSVLSGGERGLLGLAFHPQYSSNRRFFVNYTRQTDGAIVIAEYHTSTVDPNVADTAETPILTIAHPGAANHNGGMIEFGFDGFLYIGTGDGGGANDPPNNAQNINALLGKILRIDIDHPDGGTPYTSPPSNPFFGATQGADEIYAYGQRNPWRYSFDRGTGQLYLGDVGQGAREEVDIVTLGGNYGWKIMEGSICNPNINGGVCTPPPGHVPPIAEYSHSAGRCSITGGFIYRGVRSSLPTGSYVFADYCTGEIFLMQGGLNNSPVLLDTPMNIPSFGQDEGGEIYVVGSGTLQRIANPSAPPRHTIGLYRPAASVFYLRNSNTAGFPDVSAPFGAAGDIPIAGDWDGDGTVTVGVYRPSISTFYLRNSNSVGAPDITVPFGDGPNGDVPIAGDWNGNGTWTIGVYRPSTSTFYLRNSNSPGLPDLSVSYGAPGDVPIVGDWDANGSVTIGVFRPSNNSFFLRNTNVTGFPDISLQFGAAGDLPLAGDWDGNGTMTIGLFRPSGNLFFLRNSNTSGFPDMTVPYGAPGDSPIVGNWDGD
jgi:glucose/arabinose dehydrogenase